MPLPKEVRLSVARWLWLLPIAVGVSLAMLVLSSLSAIDRGESPRDLQEAQTFLLLIDEVAVNARESGDDTTLALVAARARARIEERTNLIVDSSGAERAEEMLGAVTGVLSAAERFASGEADRAEFEATKTEMLRVVAAQMEVVITTRDKAIDDLRQMVTASVAILIAAAALAALASRWSRDAAERYRAREGRTRRELEVRKQELVLSATHDSLTGLLNRAVFLERLQSRADLARSTHETLALVYVDVDRLKLVNDARGHAVGDELLRATAGRLAEGAPSGALVSRLGGDEFAVAFTAGDRSELTASVERLSGRLTAALAVEDGSIRTSASMGVSVFPQDANEVEALVRCADLAMYEAKRRRDRRYVFFTRDLELAASKQNAIELGLRFGMEHDEFELHYQPIVDLHTNEVVEVEALVRWNHPQRGSISAAEFIPVAEQSGLILALGKWVLREACVEAKRWSDAGCGIPVAVNISPLQLRSGDLETDIAHQIDSLGLSPSLLSLEVTETASLEEGGNEADLLRRLRERGVSVALDDFGTGHSSLTRLRNLPVATLKIDGTFVSGLPDDGDDKAIVEASLALGGSLALRVVAEGVETEQQLEALIKMGCRYGQGFLLHRPYPAEELMQLLRGGSRERAA